MSRILITTNCLLILIISTSLNSCFSDNGEVFNALSDLSNGLSKDTVTKFEFTINDTASVYDIDLLIRHDVNYPHYNLYLDCELGTDSILHYKKVREFFLFDPSTGNPNGFNTFMTGKSLGGFYDHQYPLFNKIRFSTIGTYTISLKNYMRDNKPVNLHAIGLSINKLD